ncbi:hypothetical protein Btru_073954 [Bulinus truncatus]|nr:hypothetical protein Btru_073954 [Bulinus truncatus]
MYEDEYLDSAFEWSFLELTERMKQFLADDEHSLVYKNNLDKPVQYHRISDTGIPRRQSGEVEDADSGHKLEIPLQASVRLLEFKEVSNCVGFERLHSKSNSLFYYSFSQEQYLSSAPNRNPQENSISALMDVNPLQSYCLNPYHSPQNQHDLLIPVYQNHSSLMIVYWTV